MHNLLLVLSLADLLCTFCTQCIAVHVVHRITAEPLAKVCDEIRAAKDKQNGEESQTMKNTECVGKY